MDVAGAQMIAVGNVPRWALIQDLNEYHFPSSLNTLGSFNRV